MIKKSYKEVKKGSEKVVKNNVVPTIGKGSNKIISTEKKLVNNASQTYKKAGEKIYEFSNSVRKYVGESISNMHTTINPMKGDF